MASNDFENLLGDFQRLPDHLPTFMEIAGFERKENACSDILAFFFDPKGPHGLGTLFLDALAQIGGIQNQEAIGSNVTVDREKVTGSGNKVDLLIQSDSHAILIENKISAAVANPFRDYAEYLDSFEQLHKHKFLLTLRRHPKHVGHGFENITHGQLVKEIRGLLGSYVADADTRYLTFLLDFVTTLDNLERGTVMGQEFLDFLAVRRNDAENFLREINRFKDELRTKVHGLATLIDVQCCSNVRQLPWREKDKLYDILGHHISLASGLVVAVDTFISPGGWEITFHVRRVGTGTQEELRKLLQRLEIPLNGERGERIIHQARFEYAADMDRIAEVVKCVVCKLAKSEGSA